VNARPHFDWDLPYASQRAPVFARNVVATSQPLAVAAGIEIFAAGGNAVDAAIATAAALTVVEPTNNGLGSDALAIVVRDGARHGLNASGPSPRGLAAEAFEGLEAMPLTGWAPVTVPGAVAGWASLAERFGSLSFAALLAPAIRYAEQGFMVSPRVAREWALLAPLYPGREDFAEAFLPGGKPPVAGQVVRIPGMAESLREIAATNGAALYTGRLAERLVAHSTAGGGAFAESDLAEFRPVWVEPIEIEYRGWSLWELPPNAQGLAALIAAGILREFEMPDSPDCAAAVHLQAEAMKSAFADTDRYVGDPAGSCVDVAAFLEAGYLASRAAAVDPERAGAPAFGMPGSGDTVYLTTADAEGTMVSFIQSNYFGFGSGVVVPGTGVSLQNRGACFTLEAGHPNRVGGGKRPRHTILPAFLAHAGRPVMSFGVMGGAMQPQGHLQVLSRIVDFEQNPQAAIDAPRWQVDESGGIALEPEWGDDVVRGLERRGHSVRRLDRSWFGGAQAAYRLNGGYAAASEPRKDGMAAGY
jgi:gamma-glutamyltranspeptidase/glutathione hydrolase